MKLLKDYTDQELATIAPEEKQQIFLLECAERGIALPASIPEYMASPEDRDDLKPDVVVYSLGGYYSSNNYYFASAEEAQAVADLVSKTSVSVDYDYRGNSDNIYYLSNKDNREIEIKPKSVYSADKYNQLKDELKRYGDQKALIENNNKRRDEMQGKHSDLMKEIDDAITEAVKNITRLEEFGNIFSQYLAMANNDHTVAVRFLLNAHYSEINDYDDGQLAKIGLSREDISKYNEASKPASEDE